MNWHTLVQRYFGIFLAAGIVGGYVFSDFFLPLSDYVLLILSAVMTLSFLTIDISDLVKSVRKIHIHALIYVVLKIVIPAGLFFALDRIYAPIALPVLLLTLTPIATITPTLSRLMRGDTAFLLVQLVISSLLTPLLLPLMLKLVAGAVVSLDTMDMMVMLMKLIFLPFVLSLLLRKFGPSIIEETKHRYGGISVLLIMVLLLGVVAKGSPAIKGRLLESLPEIGLAFLLGLFLIASGYFPFPFLEKEKRISLALGNLFMNVGLTLVIASQYFSAEVVLFCLVYELPANTLPVAMQRLFSEKKAGPG